MSRDSVEKQLSTYVYDPQASGPSEEKLAFEEEIRGALKSRATMLRYAGGLLAVIGNRSLDIDDLMYNDDERLGVGNQRFSF